MADRELHVLPVRDIVEHDASEGCICGPSLKVYPHDSSHGYVWVYAHHSLDRREVKEGNKYEA